MYMAGKGPETFQDVHCASSCEYVASCPFISLFMHVKTVALGYKLTVSCVRGKPRAEAWNCLACVWLRPAVYEYQQVSPPLLLEGSCVDGHWCTPATLALQAGPGWFLLL